jgi:hypothetical protein
MSKNEPAPEVTLADLQARWNRLREAATAEARKQACGTSQGVWVAVLAGMGLLGLAYLLGWNRGRRAQTPTPALPPATPEPVSAASAPVEPPAAKAAAAPGMAALLTPLADSLVRYGLAALNDHLDRTAKRRDN